MSRLMRRSFRSSIDCRKRFPVNKEIKPYFEVNKLGVLATVRNL